jgi:hypothetical protein
MLESPVAAKRLEGSPAPLSLLLLFFLLLLLVTTLAGTSHDHGQGQEKRSYQSPQTRSCTQPILSFLVLTLDGPRFANGPGASDAKLSRRDYGR